MPRMTVMSRWQPTVSSCRRESGLEDGDIVDVRAPYDGALIAHIPQGTPRTRRRRHWPPLSGLEPPVDCPAFRTTRAASIATGIPSQRGDFPRTIALEAGNQSKSARTEVAPRCLNFQHCRRIDGSRLRRYIAAGLAAVDLRKLGHRQRFPFARPPSLASALQLFPLNLSPTHCPGPSPLGCSMVLKPAPQTPLTRCCCRSYPAIGIARRADSRGSALERRFWSLVAMNSSSSVISRAAPPSAGHQ